MKGSRCHLVKPYMFCCISRIKFQVVTWVVGGYLPWHLIKWIWYCAGLWPWVLRKKLGFLINDITSKSFYGKPNSWIWAIDQRKVPTTGKTPAQFSDWPGWCLESKDFVLLCLLCAFLVQGVFRGKHTWQVVEFFSGKARLSRLAAKCGYPVASLDLENDPGFRNREKTSKHPFPHRSFMDFNGESGFAPLNLNLLLLSPCIPCHILWCLACSSGFPWSSSSKQPLAKQSSG